MSQTADTHSTSQEQIPDFVDPHAPIQADLDAAAAENTIDDAGQNLQAELDSAQSELALLKDQLLRARADTENARRRGIDDVAKAHKFAVDSFAESLLPVKDTLELGLANTSQTEAALREGVAATLRLLTTAFEKHKLLEINPAAGDKFDPTYHNGISMMPSPHPAQTVAMVMQKGYVLSDRVLRSALVAVSSGA